MRELPKKNPTNSSATKTLRHKGKKIISSIDFLYKQLIARGTWNEKIERHLRKLHFTKPQASWDCFVTIAGQADFKKLFPSFLSTLIAYSSASFDPSRALSNLERFSKNIYDKNYLYTILDNNKWLTEALICLFSGSQHLTDILLREPGLFALLRNPETINLSKTKDRMYRELVGNLEGVHAMDGLLRVLREFKRQEFLRIGLRDLLNKADLVEIMEDISNVADVCLQYSYQFCEHECIQKFGVPVYTDEKGTERKSEFSIIGMGKLGGRELNFSSDIDLLYLYSSDRGKTGGSGIRISNHEFYVKLSTMITKAIGEITDTGNVFRVDLRLRPEGNSGDIACSLRSYEIYYESWGQAWERQALIKARTVAGSEELGSNFFDMTKPFIYRKYLDITAIDEVKNMKERINKAVAGRRAEVEDIKLDRGGIREIEFIIQVFQLIYGGKDERIREKNSLRALKLIHQGGYINTEDYETLVKAYRFLRNLEHRVQISFGLQTHKIPDSAEDRAVLAKKMRIARKGNKKLSEELMRQYFEHTKKVQNIYDSILSQKVLPDDREIKGLQSEQNIIIDDAGELMVSQDFLKQFHFVDLNKVVVNLTLMYKGPSFSHPSPKSREYFQALAPEIVRYSALAPSPDQAINNMEKFVSSSGSKENMFSIFLENKKTLEMLLTLFGSSDFLSQTLITQPDLIVALLDFEGINRPKAKEKMTGDLNSMLSHAEDRKAVLDGIRLFKKGEELRIGLRFITGRAGMDGTCEDLSMLAEVCLNAAFEISERDMKKKYGIPSVYKDGKKTESRLSVIGMGKLGGYELDFGSDLDLLFIYSEDGTTTDNYFYFTKVCESIFRIITEVSRFGAVYKLDPSLRPEGEQGVLTVSIDSFEKYIKTRGQTWEKQALIKARPVAGDMAVGALFIEKAHQVLYKGPFAQSTKKEIRNMRKRIETEIGKGKKDVKHGYGGLIDITFITQLFQMRYGIDDISLRTTRTLPALDELKRKGILSPQDHQQLKDSYNFYKKIQMGLRIENQKSQNVLPASLNTLARRMGYADSKGLPSAQKFMRDYAEHIDRVRKIYDKIF